MTRRLASLALGLLATGACASADDGFPTVLASDLGEDESRVACSDGPQLSADALALIALPPNQLEALWSASSASSSDALRGDVFVGVAAPALFDVSDLAAVDRKFAKAFYDDGDGVLAGSDLDVKQGADEEGYCLILGDDRSLREPGFFAVTRDLAEDPTWKRHHAGAELFDYFEKIAQNPIGPVSLMRQYVVQPTDSPDLLLGKSFFNLPFMPAIGFFVLERAAPVDSLDGWTPSP